MTLIRVRARSFSGTLSYDAYLRPATNATSGSSSDQNLTLVYQYDRSSLMTNLTQVSGVTSATTSTVQRALDGYGQVTEEQVSLNGAVRRDFTQVWDVAGRRYQLSQSGAGKGGTTYFWHQADGLLTQEAQAGQYYEFVYDDNGLLIYRVSTPGGPGNPGRRRHRFV